MPAAPAPPVHPPPNKTDRRRDGLLMAGILLAVHVGGSFDLIGARQPAPSDPHAVRLLLDPNTASADELMLLPGIGPALSSRIVQHRQASEASPPFAAADDLEAVKRIGPVTVENLRPFLTFPAQADLQP